MEGWEGQGVVAATRAERRVGVGWDWVVGDLEMLYVHIPLET